MSKPTFEKGKMVPVPSRGIVPERDVNDIPVLECTHLGIDFGGLHAVEDFNLTKVYKPTHGTILLDGVDTAGYDTSHINRMGIARTFQNIRLFSNLSVEDNVKIGLHNQMRYTTASAILRLPAYWRQEKAAHARAAAHLRHGGVGRRARGQPALRRAAPP